MPPVLPLRPVCQLFVLPKFPELNIFRVELSFHPDVQEASVVARSHPKWGERPMAFVILTKSGASKWKGKDDEFTQDLVAFARKRLPGFACPEWVRIVEELPKTS